MKRSKQAGSSSKVASKAAARKTTTTSTKGFVVIDGAHVYVVKRRFGKDGKELYEALRGAVRGCLGIYPTPHGCEDRFLIYCNDETMMKTDVKFNDLGAYVLDALGLYVSTGFALLEPIVVIGQDERLLSDEEIEALLWLASSVTEQLDNDDDSSYNLRELMHSLPTTPPVYKMLLWGS